MPTKKTTRPERPRRPGAGPALNERPDTRRSTATAPRPSAPAPNPKEPRKPTSWRAIRENVGWGLVIGLPIILVILAILWRSTNGFQGTPADRPLPTIAPTATAGNYLAPPAIAPGGARNRLLYFQSATPEQPAQLFSADADGANPVQLTNTAENKSTPVWSPDGKQVAFAADGVGLQLVNFDGSGLHTVAYNGFAPVWSPDSKQLAFLKQEPATDGRGPDNTGLVRFLYLTNVAARPGQEKQLAYDALGPNWSPDGKEIAFFSLRNAVMFTVPATGGQASQLNTGGLGGWFPSYSPDGNTLVFYGSREAAQFVKGLDQGSLTPIPVATGLAATATATAAATGTPSLTIAPTPTAIPPAVINLYRINRDGSGLKQLLELENPPANLKPDAVRFGTYIQNSAEATALLVNRPTIRVSPIWSPDGKQVAVLLAGAGRDTAGISLVPIDGSAAFNIIAGENGLEAGTRLSPTFSEDGNRLYYWFQPTEKGSKKTIRAFDLGSKKESPLISAGDNAFPRCCGFKR